MQYQVVCTTQREMGPNFNLMGNEYFVIYKDFEDDTWWTHSGPFGKKTAVEIAEALQERVNRGG